MKMEGICMKGKTRLPFALFAIASLIFLSIGLPTVGEEENEEEGCTVSGQVIVTGTLKPIREAVVILYNIDDLPQDPRDPRIPEWEIPEMGGNTYVTITNGEGYYEFVGIPAGTYLLIVIHGSAIKGDYHRTHIEVCYFVIPMKIGVSVWLDVTTTGIYYTSFEIEDGDSIVINVPIDPIHFQKSKYIGYPILIDVPNP